MSLNREKIACCVALLIFRSRFGQQVRAVMSNRAMAGAVGIDTEKVCLLYTSPSPRDLSTSRMPSSA